MTPEKAFQLYFAIRLHFTTTYDVFEQRINFKGKDEVSSRKDFSLIFPIMKQVPNERELIEFCVANHLYGNPDFLYDDGWAIDNYKHWLTSKQSLSYNLEKDLSTIETFVTVHGITLQDYLSNQVISDLLSQRVEYESLILFDRHQPIIGKIEGFDSLKYKVRMYKASKFVNKGTIDARHISHIDSFLATLEGEKHGNNIVATTQE